MPTRDNNYDAKYSARRYLQINITLQRQQLLRMHTISLHRRVLYHTLVVATMSASVLVPGAVCLVCVHANDERCSAKICLRTRRISAYLKYLQVHGLI